MKRKLLSIGLTLLSIASWQATNAQNFILNDASIGSPTTVSSSMSAGTECVQKMGNYIYVGYWGSSNIDVYDLTNPGSPALINTQSIETPFTTGCSFLGMAEANGYLYVVSRYTDKLYIIDVTDPMNLVVVGSVAMPVNNGDIVVEGNYAYVATIDSGGPLTIVDVSNPASPTIVSQTPFGTGAGPYYNFQVAKSGNYVFLNYYNNGGVYELKVVDVSNPAVPVIANNNAGGVTTIWGDFEIIGTALYFTYNNGGVKTLRTLDISNPVSPVFASDIVLNGNAESLNYDGQYLYAGCQVSSAMGALTVIDVSTPLSPSVLAQSETSSIGAREDVFVVPGYAYVMGNNPARLNVFPFVCPINDQTVTAAQSSLYCFGETDINLGSTETGMQYSLYNGSNEYLGMVEGTGSAESINTGHITATDTYSVEANIITGGLTFDGVDDYVNLGSNAALDITGDVTVETWVNVNSMGSDWVRLIGKGDFTNRTYGLWVNPNGTLLWQMYNGAYVNTEVTGFTLNEWHHIAGVRNGSTCDLYLDGELVASKPYTGNAFSTAQPATIGSMVTAHDYLNGQMDEARIWNVAKTQAEIKSGMVQCLAGNEPGLVAYYQMEDGTGATCSDLTSNALNGTLTNMNTATAWGDGTGICSPCSLTLTQSPTVTISSVADQTVSITDATLCPSNTGTTVNINSSEVGVNYYLRDDANDTIVDGPIAGTGSSLTFNTGVLANTMTYNVIGTGSSVAPGSMKFDGVDDYISVPSISSNFGANAITVETWASIPSSDNTDQYTALVGQSYTGVYITYGIYIINGQMVTGFFDGAWHWTTPVNYPTDQWIHVASSYDQNTMRLYINGVEVANLPETAALPVGFTPWYLGRRWDGTVTSPYLFSGELKDTRIWNVAKTAGEITGNMNSCINGSEANLVLFYNYSNGSGNNITNMTGNGYNGTMINMAGDNSNWIAEATDCIAGCTQVMSSTVSVTVGDAVAPTAVCQNITAFLDGAGNATITAADIDGGSTDDCSAVTLSASKTSFTCADVGANTVTLTATDASSNSSTCSATVTIMDTVSPVAVCQNITVYLDGTGNATITATDIDGGSSDNCAINTMTVNGGTSANYTCADLGSNSATLLVTDASGNSSSCIATVTVADTVSPSAVCQNITVFLDGSGNAAITAADIDGGSSDNCGTPSLSASATAFTCANAGANAVTLTVTDGSANTSTCIATVTVLDTISPLVSCQNITVYLDGAGNASITAGDIDGGSSDNCGAVALNASATSFTCANIGVNAVSLTATDGSSNTGTCVATVTVADTTSPVTPTLVTETDECAVTLTAPTTTDNCGGTITGTTIDPLTYSGNGSSTVTWTFTDASGNTTTATQNVIINDVTPPSISAPANVSVTANDAGCTASGVALGSESASDNCGMVTVTNDAPATFPLGNTTVTWTAMDAAGLTATATQIVTVTSDLSVATDSTWDALCAGSLNGQAFITVAGGTMAYAYDWDNDGTGDNDDAEDAELLGAGTYNVVVTDANGCTAATSATIGEPTALTASNTVVDPSACATADGSVNASVNGGTMPYTYAWDNMETTEDLANVGAGAYVLTVTDANGCEVSTSATLNDPSGPVVVLDSIHNNDCFEGLEGGLFTTTTGGDGSYTFAWDNMEATDDITGLAAGTYNLTVTDGTGCIGTVSGTVTEATAITFTANTNPVSCFGGNDGDASLTISGGTGTLVENWGTADPMALVAGYTTFTITDDNMCIILDSILISQPDSIELTIAGTILCNGDSTTIDVEVAGGTAPYTYDWDNDGYDDMQDSTNAKAGSYTVMVMDANGCMIDSTFTIVEPTVLTVSLTATDEMFGNDGTIDLTVSGGTPTYSYAWDNTATTEDLSGLVAGTYSVTITDLMGCVQSIGTTIGSQVSIDEAQNVTMNVYPNPTNGIVNIEFSQNIDGTITVFDAVGQIVAKEQITNIKQTINLENNERGIYFLKVESGNNSQVVNIVLQ